MFWVRLFEPRGDVVTNPEVVSDNANPAGTPYEHCGDNLTDDTDRLLENVDHAPNSATQTCQIKNCSHVLVVFIIKQ